MQAKILQAALLVLVLVQLVASPAAAQAAQPAQDIGDAIVPEEEQTELPTTQQGETIISGLDDGSLSLLSAEYSSTSSGKDGVVTLVIRSDTSKSIQVLDAFGSGGETATILTPETRSLSSGRNEVEIPVNTANGVAIVNVQGSGNTAQIPVRAGTALQIPETSDLLAWAAGIVAFAAVAVALAWTKMQFAGQEQRREL
jgi:hypothetical protein